jgi:hypothetical protein
VRVAQAYFDVLASQDTLATARANKAAITEQLASAKRNFEVGTATITDTREAQARFDLAPPRDRGRERPAHQAHRARPAGGPHRRAAQAAGRAGGAAARATGRRRGMGRPPTSSTRRCAARASAWTWPARDREGARRREAHARRGGSVGAPASGGSTPRAAGNHQDGQRRRAVQPAAVHRRPDAEPHQGNPGAGREGAPGPGRRPPRRGAGHARGLLRRAVGPGPGQGAGSGRGVQPSWRWKPRSWATRSACASTSTC